MSFIEYIFAQFNADSYQISFNFLVSKCLTRQTCITLKLIVKEQNKNNCNMVAIFTKVYVHETKKFNIL